MLQQNFTQGFKLIQRINPAGRVAGAVDDEHPRPGRDGFFQLRRVYFEPLFDTGVNDDRLAFRNQNDVRIGDPVGRGYDDFVAGIDDGQRQIEETLLAAARNQDLPGSVVKAILALEFGNDGIFQAGRAADRRIFCETPC